LHKLLVQLEEGNAKAGDLDLIDRICNNMMGNTVCVLADAAAMPTQSFLTKFRDEFVAHITHAGCPLKKSALQSDAA
jgi:NADH-quinone oxidoreductase subunit F